jgi:hypothetical protein
VAAFAVAYADRTDADHARLVAADLGSPTTATERA